MENIEVRYLSQSEIKKLNLGIQEIIHIVEETLKEHSQGKVEMPPKIAIHPQPDSFMHAMPACIPRMEAAGLKWVGCFPSNYQYDLVQTTGVVVINDFRTGVPVAIVDGTWITAMRTAAVTAVGAKYLAREDSEVLGIVGAGVQGRSNLAALNAVLPKLNLVKVFDVREEALKKYSEKMSSHFNGEIRVVDSAQEAIEASDVVVTATKSSLKEPFAKASWIKPGSFIAPLEADHAWEPEAIQLVNKFVTDDWNQTKELAERSGYFPQGLPDLYAELGEIVQGSKEGRESDKERIMSMCIGLALNDISVGKRIYEIASRKEIGENLPLI